MSGQERAPIPWTLGDVVAGGVLVMLISGLSLLLVRLLIALPSLERVAGIVVIGAAALAEGSIALAVWLFAIRRRGARWADLGLREAGPWQGLLGAWLVLWFGMAVQIAYIAIVRALGLQALLPPPIVPRFARSPGAIATLFVLAVVVAPLVEELFFRGFMFPALAERLGAVGGAAISALVFALAHAQLGTFVPIFLLGLALAGLAVFARSIWPCIAVHATYNFLGLLAGLAQQALSRGTPS